MESLDQQLKELSFLNDEPSCTSSSASIGHVNVAELVNKIRQKQRETYTKMDGPPKPSKNYNELPQVPFDFM